ncbi:hypothetical protein ID866_4279 [Astraeus odoratus]|nr:hypothetical protein ID866_4279 [Astraeus odoratus]
MTSALSRSTENMVSLYRDLEDVWFCDWLCCLQCS